MSSAAALISRVRTDASLSIRELARRAAVPASTVSRIEADEMDPTVAMLERLVAAGGQRLTLRSNEWHFTPSIADLADISSESRGERHVNWTRLRGFVDWLSLHPEEIRKAIAAPPRRTGFPQLDNLLAAIAEKLADDAKIPRPKWCVAVPPLVDPWRAHGTPRMIARAAQGAPKQFAMRNIWLARSDVWREIATTT